MNLRKKVQTRKTRMAEKKKETSIKLPQHNKESPKIQDTYEKEKHYTQEDNVLNFQKKEQMTKYGQRRLGIKGEVEKAIISHVTGPK